MPDQRRTGRALPTDADGEVFLHADGITVEAVVSNVSLGGICVIVPGTTDFRVGQEVTVEYRDRDARAVVRHLSHDGFAAVYGFEWVQPVSLELWPLNVLGALGTG